ncbi:MAG: efflux RND transporter periplasmic adaptor subunit [Cardiobacteriaceae bacterium]|nr:efflux RND transporter periplasmic adaptor subunit [Cardiobacteriaceae bacterium]
MFAKVLCPALLALLPWFVFAQEPPQAAEKPVLTVAVVQPERMRHAQTLTAEGEVAAREMAAVNAQVAGVALVKLHADVGDRVKAGQLLAEFDSAMIRHDLAQATAAVSRAEAALQLAKTNATRARKLVKDKAISQSDADRFASGELEARAALDGALAARDAAQLRLGYATVHAPLDGVIIARPAEIGMTANIGVPLFTLMAGGELEWRAQVAALDVAKLKLGMPVQLALGDGESVTGRLKKFAPVADARSRRVTAFVALDAHPLLRAGLFLRGDFRLGEAEVLTVPAAALVREDGYDYVMRVDGDGRVVREKPVFGARLDDRVVVESGLAAEARIVARGGAFLQDGDLVRVAE